MCMRAYMRASMHVCMCVCGYVFCVYVCVCSHPGHFKGMYDDAVVSYHIPCLLVQMPRLLFISSRNLVQLLFESGY